MNQLEELKVYETDSSPGLPEYCAYDVVVGNKILFTTDKILATIPFEVQVILVTFG